MNAYRLKIGDIIEYNNTALYYKILAISATTKDVAVELVSTTFKYKVTFSAQFINRYFKLIDLTEEGIFLLENIISI